MIFLNNIFTFIYLIINIGLIYVVVIQKNIVQIPVKIISTLVLLLFYYYFKEKKKTNIHFFITLIAFLIGDILYSFPFSYFEYVAVAYSIVYFSILLNSLKVKVQHRDFFKIFTFAIPFLFTYTLIIMMLENLSPIFLVVLIIGAVISSGTISVSLLNYAYERNEKNYLVFIGAFMLQIVNFLVVIHHFNDRNETMYYLISHILSVIAQYFLCVGFTFRRKKISF